MTERHPTFSATTIDWPTACQPHSASPIDRTSIGIILLLHLALIAPIAWTSSPNCDELAHLASGIYHWQVGRFDVYRVNPPLHRMWCTIPLAVCQPKVKWKTTANDTSHRSEWRLANQLLETTTPAELRCYLVSARLMGMPIVALGGIASYLWAHQRYGDQAALGTLILWCFSPNVLSWGATICPDVAGAAIGLCASYVFSRWLVRNDWLTTVSCGVLQGLSILTKSTWFVLFFTTPLVILCVTLGSRHQRRTAGWMRGSLLIAICLVVINLGYGLEGTCTPLSEFEFQSRLFRRMQDRLEHISSAFAWRTTTVPLPFNFVMGIDQQRHEFEQGKWSYLCGQWSDRGWHAYYVVCAALKMPLGFWLLVGWTVVTRCGVGCDDPPQHLAETLALWIPPICLAVIVSSQNGFSRHFRYIFPCLPFAYIVAGQAVRVDRRINAFRFVGVTAVLGFAVSSISTWPFCHSYFNELAGGPRAGYRFLLDSNIDWGEDVLHAEAWLNQHPRANPIHRGFVTDEFAAHRSRRWQREPPQLSAGWYLVSIHRVMDPTDWFSVLRRFRPVDRIGYSTIVYHVKTEDFRHSSVDQLQP